MIYRRRRILLSEVERQCTFALMAYRDATAALERLDACRFWYGLQALLTSASNLNQLLWPSPGASAAWAAELRGALGARDNSPVNHAGLALVPNMVATLQSWKSLSPDQPLHLSNFSPDGFTGEAPVDCVRCFDPRTSVFILFGHVFELPPLLAAIAELGRRAELELQHLRKVV